MFRFLIASSSSGVINGTCSRLAVFLLVMAHPVRVAFGLALASSSSELMNASMTLLRSYVLVFLSVGWPAIKGFFCCSQCLTVTFTLLFAFILHSDGLTAPTFQSA